MEVCEMSEIVANSNDEMNRQHDETNPEERMRALIDTISAYIEHYHGGGVEMVDYQDSVLRVRLSGACDGCELATVTLHGWVEGTVKQFFPDLKRVETAEVIEP
jgi:Fe-S cluster biogenesis protein NfuA